MCVCVRVNLYVCRCVCVRVVFDSLSVEWLRFLCVLLRPHLSVLVCAPTHTPHIYTHTPHPSHPDATDSETHIHAPTRTHTHTRTHVCVMCSMRSSCRLTAYGISLSLVL
eukprot:GHVQ01008511.1.p1 GENE.GHVQ01008511.1~~GHVQ01008511.1.p1  ORF type:complete len:110 (+),score=21.58 GHVQ01008511.1:180-509(+)